ncbi:MAG: DJ-1/PfpI family protein [Anaerolineales bacterium]
MKEDIMRTKNAFQRCILTVIAQGFDEAETISLISMLRQAGLCVKSMGMTSGLVSGAYGICLMPDLTLSDLDSLSKMTTFSAVILPENRQCLARLEADPRLHNFLRQVLTQGGCIVAGAEGRQFLKKIPIGDIGLFRSSNGGEPLLLPRDQGQSVETLARDLVFRMGQPARL